jgi:starvation-inducible DNA-binding protein
MAYAAQILERDAMHLSANELQAVLVDLVDLSLQGKQAHWNVIGLRFRSLHLEFDELVDDVRKWSDEVAERLRALGVAADGRASVIAQRSGLESLPEGTLSDGEVLRCIANQVATVAARGSTAIDRLDGTDKVSEDILLEIVQGLEKRLWMFRSQLS